MLILKTIRTVRHLKPVQLYGQIRNRLRRYWERPERFAHRLPPELGACRWRADVSFHPPGAQRNTSENILAGRMVFLNREEAVGWPPLDWAAPGLPRLWQYNLHYFEWLWALEYKAVREAILSWIEQHNLAEGRVGWEPYPTSLRLMNWCGICFGTFRAETEHDGDFAKQVRRSISLQTEWLARHLEIHLGGNHLFENAAALVFVGTCFAGEGPENWLKKGMDILRREIPEQILEDGMHFERSPMYHLRITYLLQMLRETGADEVKALVDVPLARMPAALAHVCHPDGEIALFNDSAFGICNHPDDVLGSRRPRSRGPWALPNAGYYGYRGEDGAYIICDAGVIGPEYIPGHAHGDIFSFELSLNGQRVIVDSGVYDYEPGPMRRYCRSTSAHNTVEIEGQDQCEFWGVFRVARRGYPRDVRWEPTPEGFCLSGRHDGYCRLPGRPVHHRTVRWNRSRGLHVRDQVHARRPVRVVSRLHLHPTCTIKEIGARDVWVEYPGGAIQITFTNHGLLRTEETFYCPEFGRKEPNTAIAFQSEGKEIELAFTIVSI